MRRGRASSTAEYISNISYSSVNKINLDDIGGTAFDTRWWDVNAAGDFVGYYTLGQTLHFHQQGVWDSSGRPITAGKIINDSFTLPYQDMQWIGPPGFEVIFSHFGRQASFPVYNNVGLIGAPTAPGDTDGAGGQHTFGQHDLNTFIGEGSTIGYARAIS